ncbi:DNA-binding response regulator [Enterococcus rivorum]|uniref:OmpR/PhoB-type domain-containing protein n=1 Tax=Enterococcus rivorum TaxID=762845 RepID=A0A1E5KX12_9ENTE|nr:winged helix-turn-helix domain-containing protein [Enterococcus rivorum]MBP2097250.1 two-component system response regulator VicR [Enterococcus rivorum]OEH82397.1 hypothetical protein BCR26_02905 [Enterococcus rivorum]
MFKVGILDNYNKFNPDTKQSFYQQCEVHPLNSANVKEQLPNLDGLVMYYSDETEKTEIYEHLVTVKNISTIPIWVISEEISSIERLIFLKLGAFAIKKEGEFNEILSLSLSNTLKLIHSKSEPRNEVYSSQFTYRTQNVKINEQDFSIHFKEGQIVHLTKLEYQLFAKLAKNPNQVVLYDELIESLWIDSDKIDPFYRLANLVFHVREKLKKSNVNPNIIRTIRLRGYMLNE